MHICPYHSHCFLLAMLSSSLPVLKLDHCFTAKGKSLLYHHAFIFLTSYNCCSHRTLASIASSPLLIFSFYTLQFYFFIDSICPHEMYWIEMYISITLFNFKNVWPGGWRLAAYDKRRIQIAELKVSGRQFSLLGKKLWGGLSGTTIGIGVPGSFHLAFPLLLVCQLVVKELGRPGVFMWRGGPHSFDKRWYQKEETKLLLVYLSGHTQ